MGIQFIPTLPKDNPPATSPLESPAEVTAILERSCFDCHSNRTAWPWYSRVAPMSLVVSHHVEEGREHLNFSTWGELSGEKQRDAVKEIREEIEEGNMPLASYTWIHREARLGEAEVQTIKKWLAALGAGEDDDADE